LAFNGGFLMASVEKRYTKETCWKRWDEWETKIDVLRELIISVEYRIKHAEKQQREWRRRWLEADK